jgi:membrane protease subunit (stomatin/prohibitin family)
MGFIRAFTGAIGGTFADQWKDFISPPPTLTDHVLVAAGVKSGQNAGRGANVKGSDNIITNGSLILVPEGFGMLTIEGGQITGFVSEAGGYQFQSNNPNSKSLFAGDGIIGSLVKQSWERFKFGGQPGADQRVMYVNMKEVAGLKYGTQNPIRYKDANYNNTMLAVTSFGNYSIRVVDPIAFYRNLVPADIAMGSSGRVFNLNDTAVAETLFAGFIGSLAVALSAYTKGGKSIDDVQGGTVEFAQELNKAVEETYQWQSNYGMQIAAVQPRGLDWDDPSIDLIQKFNLGTLMQGNVGNAAAQMMIAQGLQSAGENHGAAGMMGVGFAGGMAGGMMGAMQQQNVPNPAFNQQQQQFQQPMQPQQQMQQPMQMQPEAQPVQPAPVAAPAEDPMAAMGKLKSMLDAGFITQEEFDVKRQEILSRL